MSPFERPWTIVFDLWRFRADEPNRRRVPAKNTAIPATTRTDRQLPGVVVSTTDVALFSILSLTRYSQRDASRIPIHSSPVSRNTTLLAVFARTSQRGGCCRRCVVYILLHHPPRSHRRPLTHTSSHTHTHHTVVHFPK